jgi:hypothetical protein
MTISDLLDQIVFDAGDESAAYRNSSRRWFNLVRSYINGETTFKYALRPVVTITTAAATTSGLYSVSEGGTNYEFIAGDKLFDETNKTTIEHESYATTREIDHAKSTPGPPKWWSDAGATSGGVRQIYLWPVPAAVYTITFPAYLLLTDVTSSNDSDSVDPFFGPISPWGSTFTAGLRFYHDLNNNEDANQVMVMKAFFDGELKKRLAQNRLSLSSRIQSRIVNTQRGVTMGRFDPAHFDNRGM